MCKDESCDQGCDAVWRGHNLVVRWIVSLMLASTLLLAVVLPVFPASSSLAPLLAGVTQSVALVLAKDSNGETLASGTAFVVDRRGFLVTALHVVDAAPQVVLVLPGSPPLRADVLGINAEHDVALLRVSGAPRQDLPPLALSDAGAVRVGDGVVVLGYPLPSPQNPALTVTQGIVSALRTQEGLIQIDAAVNPGDSGAPVLTLDGRVIGIVDASVKGAQQLNLVVPINFAQPLIERAATAGALVTPMTLPLTRLTPVTLTYQSQEFGFGARQALLGVACATPSPDALLLEDVNVAFEAQGALHVITWLSWGKGAPLNSPLAFARLDGTSVRKYTGTLTQLSVRPAIVCLNYEAWNDTAPVGLTFNVVFMLGYRSFTIPP